MIPRESLRRAAIAALASVLALQACGGREATPVAPIAPSPAATPSGPPNVVIILADDLGYGDLGDFGATQIRTPNLDRLAAEGVRLTNYTVPAPVCAPSRAALMTGRYPVRTGIPWNPPRHLGGDEITLGGALREVGYGTHVVGKWHLGYDFQDWPLQRGFDTYFGSLDNQTPFMSGNTVVSERWGAAWVTRLYTEEAQRVIRVARERPFFLYLAYRAPHVPLKASPDFEGRSPRGLYGDVVEELDWGVGEVVRTLQETGVDRKTLVLFASDNGPWRDQGPEGGSPGPFRGGKGTPFEGGLRQPAIAWWPGRIAPGRTIAESTSVMDLFPTALALAGGRLRADRSYDGQDITRLLTGEATRLPGLGIDGGRELLVYISQSAVGLRSGKWKFLRNGPPALYDLEADPGERSNLGPQHPDLASQLEQRLDALAAQVARTK